MSSDPFLDSNPEFQFGLLQIAHTMETVEIAYWNTCESCWQRKIQLEQGITLAVFESDCQKVRLFCYSHPNIA